METLDLTTFENVINSLKSILIKYETENDTTIYIKRILYDRMRLIKQSSDRAYTKYK